MRIGNFISGVRKQGQVTTEVLLLAPVFLFLAFMAIQIAHIGLGVALVHYATSSVARQAISSNSESVSEERFKKFMIAGLSDEEISVARKEPDSPVTQTLTVVGCAKLPAYPLVGESLKASWKGVGINNGCTIDTPWISLTPSAPYKFVVRAKTIVRTNYKVQ